MDLKEYCYSLSSNNVYALAIKMCENALPIWDDYTLNNELNYRDTVAGLNHIVRPELLLDTIQFCKEGPVIGSMQRKNDFDKLLEEFIDPIVALQDLDWELPYSVERTFYAVYNLLTGAIEKSTIFDEKTHYVSVNQAADAITEYGELSIEEVGHLIYL